MSTKTISLRVEAYEKLRRARSHPTESFSDVVMRARWQEVSVTGEELLSTVRERGPLYTSEELDRVDNTKRDASDPEDKWSTP